MAALPLDEYAKVIIKSGLMSSDEVESAQSGFQQTAEPETRDDAEAFARHLEGQGSLTRWQNDKLLDKKYKGFFLSSYRFLDKIGEGGMGKVYLAEHTALHRRSAIKILPRSLMKDTSHLDRFRLEARALAQLDHKNIVRVYDIGEERGMPYIVMEHVDGLNLEALIASQGPLNAIKAAHFIGQAAAGLAHAHSRNMIHRDVKPSNLLLDPANTIKVLDLGLARLTDDDTSLTQQFSDKTLGTTDYIAPEQAVDCHGADARADIYSLGCTLYFLLTGHPPFNQGNVTARLLAHQNQAPPPVSEECTRLGLEPVDAGLIAICDRMMAKSPDERPQTAREVFELLSGWLRSRRDGSQVSSQSTVAAASTVSAVNGTEPAPSGNVVAPVASAPVASPAVPTVTAGGVASAPATPPGFPGVATGDTAVTPQAEVTTAVNTPGIAPSDIFSQSSIYSSSTVGGSSGVSKRNLSATKREPKRGLIKRYHFALTVGGGVLALILTVAVISMFAGGDEADSGASTGNTAPEPRQAQESSRSGFDF